MTLVPTLLLLLSGLALAGFCAWRERRPKEIGQVSLFPTTLLMAVGVMLAVLATAHLVSLLTGTPLKGRMMP